MAEQKKKRATTPEPDKIETRENEQTLKCILTNSELLEAGSRLADAEELRTRLDKELAEVKDQFKSKISAAESSIARYANMLVSKYEWRPVKCKISLNYTSGLVTVVREDTGEEIESRAMTDDEKQMEMQFQ